MIRSQRPWGALFGLMASLSCTGSTRVGSLPARSAAVPASVHDAILAGFAADSLSLGAHWEYDTDVILRAFHGKVEHLAAPISAYHSGKSAGEQTHTGDNSLYLLEAIAASPNAFSIDTYMQYWRSKWDVVNPPAYVDHATKVTLEGLRAGKTGREAASTDDDMSHAAKFFPLLAIYHTDEQQLVDAVKQLVTSFQRGVNEEATGEWMARVAFRVIIHKQKPSLAIDQVTAEMGNAWLRERVALGKKSAMHNDVDALRSYGESKQRGDKTFYTGLSCGTAYGIPAVVHYVNKYEDSSDPAIALIEDVSIGGNSNARSIVTAILLFGYRGLDSDKMNGWIAGLKNRPRIEELLKQINTEPSTSKE